MWSTIDDSFECTYPEAAWILPIPSGAETWILWESWVNGKDIISFGNYILVDIMAAAALAPCFPG